MSQKRVDELEAKVGPSGEEYIGGQGLRVTVNRGPNTWSQVVQADRGMASLRLGLTRRVSFANAKKVGKAFKDWAEAHTREECRVTAGRFRELAQTNAGKRRVPYHKLERALREATGEQNGEGGTDQEQLDKLKGDAPHPVPGGEGPEHKNLKEHVKRTPSILGLPQAAAAESEYRLKSHDSVDVMFCHRGKMVCVEVKSKISDTADIARGIFQCIKYQAVTEATMRADGLQPNVRSVLVLGRSLPQDLRAVQKKLCVEVIENVEALK